MTPVYLSLGSNIDRYRHITAGLDALDVLLNNCVFPPFMKVIRLDLTVAIF